MTRPSLLTLGFHGRRQTKVVKYVDAIILRSKATQAQMGELFNACISGVIESGWKDGDEVEGH